jgi:hypothetical protein
MPRQSIASDVPSNPHEATFCHPYRLTLDSDCQRRNSSCMSARLGQQYCRKLIGTLSFKEDGPYAAFREYEPTWAALLTTDG